MYHQSDLVFEPPNKSEGPSKNPSKSIGAYFQMPLIKSQLSCKQSSSRVVFRSMVYTQNTSDQIPIIEGFQSTFKLIYLDHLSKRNKNDATNLKKIFRRHYRIDIKNYLKRKYCKSAFQIPIEALEVVRTHPQSQSQKQECQRPWKTENLNIYKPYYFHGNLRKVITESFPVAKEFFSIDNVLNLVKQLLKCSLEFGGLDNFIMTTSNVYVDSNLTDLVINYSSFVGLSFYKGKQSIFVEEFLEIAPYLTPHMISTGEINVQDKIRFLLINALSLVRRKDFFYETETYAADKEFKYEDAVKILFEENNKTYKLRNNFVQEFSKIFENSMTKKRINKTLIKNVRKLMEDVLVKGESFQWSQVVQSICFVPENTAKFSKEETQKFQQLHNELFELDQNKKFYIDRGLDSFLLYLPIKLNANLSQIFKQGKWWQLFSLNRSHQEKTQNFQWYYANLSFCVRLLTQIVYKYKKAERTAEVREKVKSDFVIMTLLKFIQFGYQPDQIDQSNQGSENEDSKAIFDIISEIKNL